MSSENTSLVLQCDTEQQPMICDALVEGLTARWPELKLTLVNVSKAQESPQVGPQVDYTLRYHEQSRTSQGLSGHLVWQDQTGKTVEGPVLNVSIMDRALRDQDLPQFSKTLIETSSLPF